MSKRLSAIEKLARRICWLEFNGRPYGKTEARYWNDLPQETRDTFVGEAQRFIWAYRWLHGSIAGTNIVCDAVAEATEAEARRRKVSHG